MFDFYEYLHGDDKDILIYGAGGVAKDLLTLLNSCIPTDRIRVVVTNAKDNPDNIYDIPVCPINDFKQGLDRYKVIVATMPNTSHKIHNELIEMGFENVIIVDDLIDKMYENIWKDPIIENKVMFSHFSGIGYGGNGKYICEELISQNENIDLVWATKEQFKDYPEAVRTVIYGSYEYYSELGTSHIWVDDQHKNYFTRKRQGQYYIQTWHGSGPLKKIEYDAENLPASYLQLTDMNSEMGDLFISALGFNTELYRRAFHYYGEVYECGHPGNDILFDKAFSVEFIKKKLNVINKKVVLYAPTFRAGRALKYPDFSRLLDSLNKRFGGEFVLLLRLHPNDRNSEHIKNSDRIINVTEYDDIQELVRISDILVTDYSSLMWDFSLQKRPVFLFQPDDKRYQVERGNYISFSEMPYIVALDEDDLNEKIKYFDEDKYLHDLNIFFEKYKSFDKGNASKSVSDLIISKIKM